MNPALSNSLFVSCGLLVMYGVAVQGMDCDNENVGIAMMSCQQEREALSEASQLNDTSHLCQALQTYTSCIKPKVEGCDGQVMIAFKVINQKYTSPPYNCQIDEQLFGDSVLVTKTTWVEQDSSVTVSMLPADNGKDMNRANSPANKTNNGETSTSISSNLTTRTWLAILVAVMVCLMLVLH